MPDDLTRLAAAYQDAAEKESRARDKLRAAQNTHRAAAAHLEAARQPLTAAIVAAAKGGMRQRDILLAICGVYTRERVRQICRAGGIGPAE